MLKFFALVTLLASCGSAEAHHYGKYTSPRELIFLVTEFEHTLRRPVGVEVMMASDRDFPSEDIVGLCIVPEDTRFRPFVMIRTSFWVYASDNARWVVVFHELGHCVLQRDHLDDIDYPDKCAHSIMRSNIGLATLCLDLGSRTREQYKQELFGDQYHAD